MLKAKAYEAIKLNANDIGMYKRGGTQLLENLDKGQELVEYALILVLVAIVVIAVLTIMGPMIGNVFSKVNSSLSHV
ncbi:MAG: hypothetical protein WBW94_07890 [Anaerolineales bacterium]